jgi:hypothetical protein
MPGRITTVAPPSASQPQSTSKATPSFCLPSVVAFRSDAGGDAARAGEEVGALRHHRHLPHRPLVLGGDRPALLGGPGERTADPPVDLRLGREGQPEVGTDRGHRHVVRRRADPARGEDEPRPRAAEFRRERLVDGVELVGHGDDPVEGDAEGLQPRGEPPGVRVPHEPAEDLIADDDDRDAQPGVICHGPDATPSPTAAPRRLRCAATATPTGTGPTT